MAVLGTNDEETQATPAPGPTAQPMRSANPMSGSGNQLFDLMNTLDAGQSLGSNIEDYLKVIKSYFTSDASSSSTTIEVRRLTQPNGAHAFVSGNHAIIMLFQETLPSDTQNFSPISDYASYALEALKNMFGKTINLINMVVVLQNDYSRAQQMARYINVSLKIATNPMIHDTTISVLGDSQYSIDPDVNGVRAYVNNLNPSNVAPRIDIGFLIYAKQPRRNNSMPIGPFEDMRPIAAVGGYTEMLKSKDQTGMVKYLPMVHITSIASDIPLPGIVPLCITIAADQFISTGRWIQQFSSFQKGKPNLGQLSQDPNDPKKLWFATDPMTLETWRMANCLPAVLAVDVVEGTARIPAVADYGYLPKAANVYEQIHKFFGARIQFDRTQSPYLIHATDFIGVYGDRSGNLVDSRNMDYVTLLADGSQDAATQILLEYPMNPTDRARVIAEKTGGTFRSIHRTNISVLSPNLLSTLAMAVQQSLIIDAPQGQTRMTSSDWMRAQSTLYQSQNFSVTRQETRGGYGIGNMYSV